MTTAAMARSSCPSGRSASRGERRLGLVAAVLGGALWPPLASHAEEQRRAYRFDSSLLAGMVIDRKSVV